MNSATESNKAPLTRMPPLLRYEVYAEISRRLTEAERGTLFAALDATVPGSGFVGHEKPSAPDEVYFVVEAPSEEAANAQADAYMKVVLQVAKSDVHYRLTLHK